MDFSIFPDVPKLADDVLPFGKFNKKRGSMGKKNMSKRKYKYPYKKRVPTSNSVMDDNIAMAASTTKYPQGPGPNRRVSVGPSKKPDTKVKTPSVAVPHPPPVKPSVFSTFTSKVTKLIPSNVKTVIEKEGAKIVKTVLQPVRKADNKPIGQKVGQLAAASASGNGGAVSQIQEKVMTFLSPYRSYLDVYSNVISTDYIVKQMVGLWVNCVSASVAWMTLGAIVSYTSASGRSFEGEGRSAEDSGDDVPKPWEDFGADAETVSLIFQGMADVAARWHDEL